MKYSVVDIDLYNQQVTRASIVEANDVVDAIVDHVGMDGPEAIEFRESYIKQEGTLKTTESGWVLTGDELITVITTIPQ